MFDFMRNRGSTAEEKRLEALGAYLDNALTAAERERFEGELSRDAELRAEMEQMRALKLQMRAMPRRRAPRSFALDPALYGRPKAQPMMQLYPALRGATALAAFFLIFTLALGAFRGQFAAGSDTAQVAAEITMGETALEESAPLESAAAVAPMMEAPAAGNAEGRTSPTAKAEAETAELMAQEDTAADSAPALPPAAGTAAPEGYPAVTGLPEGDLMVEEEAVVEATVVVAESAAETAEEMIPFYTMTEAEETGSAEAGDGAARVSLLPAFQIGLAAAFLLLLIFWLIARRRVRSFQ